jgi:uncharacterized membrane protein
MTEDLENLALELRRRGIPPKYFAEQKRRGMSPQEIIAAWPPRPISNRVGSRRFRRRLVVATYAGWLLVAAIVKLMSLTQAHGETVLLLVLASGIIQAIWLSRRTIINTPKLADEELDERLVQIKNQAYRRAFQVFGPVAIVGWLVSWAAITLQPGDQGTINALILFCGVALLGGTLPTVIVAWREPDPLTGNEESS